MNARPPPTFSAAPRRVLFIDFDGVLHPTLERDASRSDDGLISTTHFGWVPVLEEVLRDHGDVRLVVHSTWRYRYDLSELREVLGELGHLVIAATPPGQRYESITWWLQMNRYFSDYRILDDDATDFPDPPPPELILCSPLTGVTAPSARQALADWLGPPKN